MKNIFILLFIVFLFVHAAAQTPLSPGRDTMLVRITRPYLPHWSDYTWAPYSVWWVEDAQENLVKVLFATLHDFSEGTMTCGRLGYFSSLTYFYGKHGCPPDDGYTVSSTQCPGYQVPPDGITGCSEPNVSGQPTIITQTWDLTNLSGNRIAEGVYHIYYNSVSRDEEYDPTDKVWRVTVTLNPGGFDTVVYYPQNLDIGHDGWAQHTVDSIEVAYGGTDGTADPGPDGGTGEKLPNVTPTPPTVERPGEPGFCGKDSAVSAALLILGLQGYKRLRKLRKRKKR